MRSVMKKGAFAVALVLLVLFSVVLPCAAEAEALPVVSHGLAVLSAQTNVAISAQVGNDIVFSADTFARGLNLSHVKYITVQSVPSVADGELLLGASRIVAGQTVTAEQMPNMVFHSTLESALCTSFTFTANGNATPMVCNLYLLDDINYTPTVSMASGLSLNRNTYQGMSLYGSLSAHDPDGDAICFEIVSYPKNGCLKLTDSARGSYVYKPYSDYVGKDAFTYVARDPYGNYSAAATVSLTVERSGTSVTYVDMKDSKAQASAIALTEKGIMSGTQVGSLHYFYPAQSVSRVEFLVMAMNAAGMSEVPECKNTSFADDAEIPTAMKGYVAVAQSMGYIEGSVVDGKSCFLPNEPLTRAQAAVMLERILGLEEAAVVPTFADHSEIPVWAADAIFSLNAAGILTSENGYIAPTATVTREQTAQMLASVMAYQK